MKPKGEKTSEALGRLWRAQRQLVREARALAACQGWEVGTREDALREAALAYASLGVRLLRRDA